MKLTAKIMPQKTAIVFYQTNPQSHTLWGFGISDSPSVFVLVSLSKFHAYRRSYADFAFDRKLGVI